MTNMKKTLATIGIAILGAGGAVTADAIQFNEVPLEQDIIVANENVKVDQIGNIIKTDMPWKGEAGLKIKYDMGEPTAAEKLKDKRDIQIITDEVNFEDGGFKIDILLDKKPKTNKFCYTIEGYENYNFLKQPEPSENFNYDNPDEMVGSYAVYHNSLRNNQYKTGKIIHIPFPQVWEVNDKDNTKQRVEDFTYDRKGNLCVIVQQDFLNKADYPVRIDPTFGYTSCGLGFTSIALYGSSQTRAGALYTLSEDATLDTIDVCLATSGGGTETLDTSAFINIADTGTDTHDKVITIEQLDLSVSTKTFYTFTPRSGLYKALLADDYILSAVGDRSDLASKTVIIYGDSGQTSVNYTETSASSYTNLRDENPWIPTSKDETPPITGYSIYVTYTAGAPTCSTEVDFEGFESEGDADKSFANNWVNGTGDDCDWQAETTTTVSSGTGPSSGAYGGGVFIFTEASAGASNCKTTGDLAYLDYNGSMPADTGTVHFHYSMYGADMGALSLEGYNGSWHTLWDLSGDQGDVWSATTTIELPATTTDIRFVGERGANFTSDMALDNLAVCNEAVAGTRRIIITE